MKTEKLVEALRCCATPGCPADDAQCANCEYGMNERLGDKEIVFCDCDRMMCAAADKIGELTDRCARYAEEIAVLQEKSKWVNAAERLPEYGVPVLVVASGKTRNITLRDAVVIATFYNGWELEDYPPADELTVKWWLPMAESPEEVDNDG